MRTLNRGSVGSFVFALLLGACSSNDPSSNGPEIVSVSAERVEVGAPLKLQGNRLIDKSKGWVDVNFQGKFVPESGGAGEAVDFTLPLVNDGGELLWSQFGAYRVPFGGGDQIGRFEGTIRATNRPYDANEPTTASSAPLAAHLNVDPSITMVEARAIGDGWEAGCKEPVTTAINGVAYLFRFRAIGFDAKQFDYAIGEGLWVNGAATTDVTRHSIPMLGNEHAVLLKFAPVPDGVDGFVTSIAVTGTAADGTTHQLQVPITVRRPLQIYFPTSMEIAQIYPPEPVSGCTPGGQTGVELTYSESHSETRTRSAAVTQADGWTKNYGSQFAETYSDSQTDSTSTSKTQTSTVTDGISSSFTDSLQLSSVRTDSTSQTSQLNFTQTDSDTYGWNASNTDTSGSTDELGGGVEAGGKAGLPLVAEGEVKVSAQYKHGWNRSTANTAGVSGSNSSTASLSAGLSTTTGTSLSEGVARAYSTQWGRSQTYSEANSYTTQQSSATTVGYSKALTSSTSDGTNGSTSETITETVSTTDTTMFGTKANVPKDAFGVWYRQTTRLVRRGVVVAYDLCGNGASVGAVTLDDWTWAPNLAIGDACPPKSDLPEAACFVEPCQ